MSRQAVTQHLEVLEAAHLVSVVHRGRERLHYLNPVPIYEVFHRWIRKFARRRLRALLEGDLTRQYWLHDNVSDWRVGSRWEHRRTTGKPQVDILGRVVEIAPPRRLVITWAFPQDEDEPSRHSRVTFEIEKVESLVRLTVTHDDLEPGSDMERGITMGWPRVLSSMKTLLETGRPLDTWAALGMRNN